MAEDNTQQPKEKKIFDKENRIYKYYINSVEKDALAVDFIKDLFKLEIIDADKSEKQDLVQLLEIVGFDKFFEILAFFGSRTIRLPRVDKAKKLLIIAIAYYQTVVLGLSPKDAGKLLGDKLGVFNLKQKSIKSIVAKLQQDIDHLAERTMQAHAEDFVDAYDGYEDETEEEYNEAIKNVDLDDDEEEVEDD